MRMDEESFDVPEPRAYPRHPQRPGSVRREFIEYSIEAPERDVVHTPVSPAPGASRQGCAGVTGRGGFTPKYFA